MYELAMVLVTFLTGLAVGAAWMWSLLNGDFDEDDNNREDR